MPARVTRAKRVRLEAGETAIAPKVNDPRGFGIENRSDHALTVSFRYDESTHVQLVVVEPDRPGRRASGPTYSGALPVWPPDGGDAGLRSAPE